MSIWQIFFSHVDPTSPGLSGCYSGLSFPDPGNRYRPTLPIRTRGTALTRKTTSASGLYYLSELVEEHTVLARKLLTRLIYSVIGLQILLALVDRFPLWLSLLSVGSHGVYMQNLRRFPIVKLTSPVFLLSCALVALNHYLWFRHFSEPRRRRSGAGKHAYYNDPYSGVGGDDVPSFTEIASFFGLQVWLVPFALFVSLSAGENVLPSMGSEYATGEGSSFARPGVEPAGSGTGGLAARARDRGGAGATNAGMAKALVNGAREWVGETGELLGLWKGERTRPF